MEKGNEMVLLMGNYVPPRFLDLEQEFSNSLVVIGFLLNECVSNECFD